MKRSENNQHLFFQLEQITENAYKNYCSACAGEHEHPEYLDDVEWTTSDEWMKAYDYLRGIDVEELSEEEAEKIIEEYDRCHPRWN